MKTLFFIAVIMLVMDIIYVFKKVGVPPSWSDSYYLLKSKGWTFQVVMILLGGLLSPVILHVTEGLWFQFLTFFITVPIMFVGAAPKFKKGSGLERAVHLTAAKMPAIASLLFVVLIGISVDSGAFLMLSISIAFNYICYRLSGANTKITFVEFACFGWTLGTILILL